MNCVNHRRSNGEVAIVLLSAVLSYLYTNTYFLKIMDLDYNRKKDNLACIYPNTNFNFSLNFYLHFLGRASF